MTSESTSEENFEGSVIWDPATGVLAESSGRGGCVHAAFLPGLYIHTNEQTIIRLSQDPISLLGDTACEALHFPELVRGMVKKCSADKEGAAEKSCCLHALCLQFFVVSISVLTGDGAKVGPD